MSIIRVNYEAKDFGKSVMIDWGFRCCDTGAALANIPIDCAPTAVNYWLGLTLFDYTVQLWLFDEY